MVLVGGYGAEYDVVTPLAPTAGRTLVAGPRARIVKPDGMELPHARFICRGAELFLRERGTVYRLGLDDL